MRNMYFRRYGHTANEQAVAPNMGTAEHHLSVGEVTGCCLCDVVDALG